MKARDARIVLTGAGGGIGRAAAAELARAGAALLLVGRSPARLAAQAAALGRTAGLQVQWHAADLTDAESRQRLAEAAAAWRANVLVHGAGLPSFGRLETLDAASIAQVIGTNLVAPIALTQAMLPQLRRAARAQVICIGSAIGRLGLPGFSVYAASKFGLRGFAEALRRELADSAVRVQYLGPRSTRTAFNDAAVEAYNAATRTAMDDPARVAKALLALLESERAEAFVGFPERLAVRLNGFAPALLDGAFAAHRASLPPPSSPLETDTATLAGTTP